MEYDIHLIHTDKKVKDIKKILTKEVFGNYDVKKENPGKTEFAIYLFQLAPGEIVLKLDYQWMNYEDVSRAIMENLGNALKAEGYWVIGLKLEVTEAFIRHWHWSPEHQRMTMLAELKDADGQVLTARAKGYWGIDTHTAYMTMQEKMNYEAYRKQLVSGMPNPANKDYYEKQWLEKFGTLDNLKKSLWDSKMFFVARKEIEKFRKTKADLKVTVEKKGKVEVCGGREGSIVNESVINPDGEDETTRKVFDASGKQISEEKKDVVN